MTCSLCVSTLPGTVLVGRLCIELELARQYGVGILHAVQNQGAFHCGAGRTALPSNAAMRFNTRFPYSAQVGVFSTRRLPARPIWRRWDSLAAKVAMADARATLLA